MKKVSLLLAAVLFMLCSANANAEGFLIKAGVNWLNLGDMAKDISGLSLQGKVGWEAGIGYQTESAAGFSLQPEIYYKQKSFSFIEDGHTYRSRISYIEVPCNIQWGLDLLILRPFIFASPFIGVAFGDKGDQPVSLNRRFDYGVGAGLGLDISKVQIAAQYRWNFGATVGGLNVFKDEPNGGVVVTFAIKF